MTTIARNLKLLKFEVEGMAAMDNLEQQTAIILDSPKSSASKMQAIPRFGSYASVASQNCPLPPFQNPIL